MRKKFIIHTHESMRENIAAGHHKFSDLMQSVFEDMGYAFQLKPHTPRQIMQARLDRNYHIFHINGAQGPRALNMRKSFYNPFWTIEKPHTRHFGRIAHKAFDPRIVGPGLARPFFNHMQKTRIETGSTGLNIKGYVLLPMQGKLCKKRPWQFADLATMVRTIRTHDPDRKIILKPHPREVYSTAERTLVKELAQLPNVEVVDAPIHALLASCAYVATHNSAVAFEGILLKKPAILFAKAHYHHLFPTIRKPEDATAAFARVQGEDFPFGAYLYWYLQMNSINVRQPSATAKIIEAMHESGWDLPFPTP